MPSNVRLSFRQSMIVANAVFSSCNERRASSVHTRARRPASRYGSGRSITAFTTLNITVLTPIPSVSVSRTTMVNPGFRAKPRAA